ncbi:phage protein [Bergeriella denitrificans]|uniref:Phage protein n=1 Tax=Bergeriella denitrificans TaxID=494 RepID=A0A378ULZ1_BERDE|nr:phage protein [Bergeriella denitrificans]
MNNDVIEHEVMDVVANQNHQAAHSVMVMEQWGNGETYNEERWIERGRQAVRQTMEGMFELGRALIILKEHTQHGRFMEIVKSQFGIGHNETARLIAATQRFATPQMQKAAPKLMDLGKSKLLELLVEEDVTLIGLAEGEEVNGMTLDDVDRMTVRELRAALRESRETAEAKDKVIADKNKKVDELAEKLEKSKKTVKEPDAADVGSELAMRLTSLEVGIRSQVSRLKEMFEQMNAHTEAHGIDHRAKMVGTINQIILDCETCARLSRCRKMRRRTICRSG